jgi:phytoene/squalene synthetase
VQVIPRRAGICVLTMAGIYQQILREIARNPRLPLQRRASLTGRSKLAVMARSWLQAM